MLTQQTSYSNARANLASLLDQVHDEHQIVVIQRRNKKNVALIAEDELSSLLESVYLLRSPANAERLFEAMAWAAEHPKETQDLADLKGELELES